MPEYLSFHATIFSVPLGWMRGSSSSSPMISASSCSETSMSIRWSPGRSPASPLPGPCSPSLPSESPTLPSPCPTPPCCLSPCLKCGMSTDGSGIATVSLPFFAIISPCEMYLRRFCLILPRMIWRNRPWSRSIFCDMRCPLEHHVGDVAALVDEAQAAAVPLRALHHLEEPQRARQHPGRIIGLELDAQPGQ